MFPANIQVNIGDHLVSDGDEISFAGVKQIIMHPKYDTGGFRSVPYDFCLIQTKEKMIIDGIKTQVKAKIILLISTISYR